MKRILILFLTILLLTGLTACTGGDQETEAEKPADQKNAMEAAAGAQAAGDENLERSRAAVKKLGGALKSALQEAMGDGGPTKAVHVCHDEAEVIAQQICDEEGLTVGRTSRNFRNPGNAPDPWEKAGLEAFAAKVAAGEKPGDLEMWTTVTDPDGHRTFRYLKAIPTAPLCLKCHGGELDPDLASQLDELYPEDQARGFSVGDLRGAFTVKIDLPRS